MSIEQYNNIFGADPEVVFAGLYLEARGYTFGDTYSVISAINLASLEILDYLEFNEDEQYGHAV